MKVRIALILVMLFLLFIFVNCATPQKKRLVASDDPDPGKAAEEMYGSDKTEEDFVQAKSIKDVMKDEVKDNTAQRPQAAFVAGKADKKEIKKEKKGWFLFYEKRCKNNMGK